MIKIIDDLLPESYINAIEKLCYSRDMEWVYVNETVYGSADTKSDLWEKQFVHTIFHDGVPKSKHYNFFMPVMFLLEEKLQYKIKSLLRLKINLLTTIPTDNSLFLPHIDLGDVEPYLSAVFYLNDSDGDTIIYENKIDDRSILQREDYQTYLERRKRTEKFVVKERVKFKKNRVVIFDGGYMHEAKWPTEHKDRFVLNMVFR